MRQDLPWAALALAAAALFCWLTVLVATGQTAGFDTAVRDAVHAAASPGLTMLAQTLTWLGTLGVLGLIAVPTIHALVRAGDRRNACLLVATMAAALVLENAIKFGVQRARPAPFFGTDPVTYSFPSGHSLFSLTLYGTLAVVLTRRLHRPVPIWAAALALVAAIGLTRIYLGVHYPSDVLGGYLVATAIIATARVLERPRHAPQPPRASL